MLSTVYFIFCSLDCWANRGLGNARFLGSTHRTDERHSETRGRNFALRIKTKFVLDCRRQQRRRSWRAEVQSRSLKFSLKDLLRSRQRSALSTEQSFSWLKRSAAVKALTRYTAKEYRWKQEFTVRKLWKLKLWKQLGDWFQNRSGRF